MPSLPLKVQVAVRDHWDGPDTGLRKRLAAVKETLGYEVAVEPEWALLLAELAASSAGPYAADKAQVVVAVAAVVEAWARALADLLADEDNNADWTDDLLEKVGRGGRLRLFVEVSSSALASTAWSAERDAFVITLPKSAGVGGPGALAATFRGELLDCFNAKPSSRALPMHPADYGGGSSVLSASVISAAPTASESDWADVGVDAATGRAAVLEAAQAQAPWRQQPQVDRVQPSPGFGGAGPQQQQQQKQVVVEVLPQAKSLPRPDELLLRPPYHMTVQARTYNEVEVQCSHGPSLQLLAEYLKQWCKVNHQDTRRPPVVEVNLCQSPFGLGMMYDRLVLIAENRYGVRYAISPTIVLHLIEGVLGYSQVSVDGSFWTYRKDVEFRR